MTPPSSSPRDESAQPGEGEAEVIAFPQAPASPPVRETQPTEAWPGQLIDLQAAREMAGVTDSASPPAATSPPPPVLGGLEDVSAVGVSDLSDAEECAGARNIALRSLAARARSEAEIRQKLADRGVAPELIDRVVGDLIDQRLVDDWQLATDLAHTLQEGKKMGPAAVRQALVKRRISRVIIDEVTAGLNPVDSETLEELARSRMRVLGGLDREVQVRRLAGYLARRGYQGSEVYRAIDRVVNQA